MITVTSLINAKSSKNAEIVEKSTLHNNQYIYLGMV